MIHTCCFFVTTDVTDKNYWFF